MDWTAVGAIGALSIGLLSLGIKLGFRHLRLMFRAELAVFRNEITKEFDHKYVDVRLYRSDQRDIRAKISRLGV